VIDIQLGLLDPAATAGLGLRIRCGLHTGPVQARDNDYFGGTINRTARIMNAAHGGQILVSQAIAELVRDRFFAPYFSLAKPSAIGYVRDPSSRSRRPTAEAIW
jgi:class 3 adenylate cyclase